VATSTPYFLGAFFLPATVRRGPLRVRALRTGDMSMSSAKLEQKALSLIMTFEKAGKVVSRVTIEGRRIEIDLLRAEEADQFERIDMRHDKA
jgi:hypothetical protein